MIGNAENVPLVSIIVPVYNVENYIDQCINSILNQSYKKIELILIDDGSRDASGWICDIYAVKDSRVSVMHKDNGGISSARNCGLERIHGEYVIFVDSDDWIEIDYVMQLISKIEKDISVVACGTKVWCDAESWNENSFKEARYNGKEMIRNEYQNGDLKSGFRAPYGKLYRSSIITDIRFDEEMVVGEDIVFNIDFLCAATSLVTIHYNGYNFRNWSGSTTHRLATKYTPLYEHGYYLITNKIFEARKRMGIPESVLKERIEADYPMRYYYEMINLFQEDSPYNRAEILDKIRIINNDPPYFSETIRKRSFFSLSNAERISWLSVNIRFPVLSYILFYIVSKCLQE